MEIFLKSIDYRLWSIFVTGSYVPLIEDKFTHIMRPKTIDELTSQDLDKICLDAKAMNVLYNALNENDLINIKDCTSTKEVLDCLIKN